MKDIDLMMSLWAPNATLTTGPGATAAGIDEIKRFWLEDSAAFNPETEWISDHPAYKLEITVNGDLGTLHFECHYIGIHTETDGSGDGRRSRRCADRRPVADHQPGGRIDLADPLRPCRTRAHRGNDEGPRLASRDGR